MKKYCLDTNIISYLLKGNNILYDKLKKEINKGNRIIINVITYYEILRGLLSIKNQKKIEVFKEICNEFDIIEINKDTFEISANIYVNLKEKGRIIEDADIFIGAICIENDFILITNNESHFQYIDNLIYENWIDV
ncbi:MAG: hypothetical protein A2Y34_05570 [Spirochaetes bacterium GWC1_27_15]|nr:MAG: hypothetical protein A2Z98_07170 [Spirochaetes bacterium GWB1_27_13]OHD22519.1 MAG: hypothetical protein A2Y34_05570 [Spirochaetes bacterium GWC1_27_15]